VPLGGHHYQGSGQHSCGAGASSTCFLKKEKKKEKKGSDQNGVILQSL